MDGAGSEPRCAAGRVKWFDQTRGFGFVLADDGGADILLHANVLRAFGQTSVAEGAKIRVLVQATQRGIQAVEVLQIETPVAEHDEGPSFPFAAGELGEAGPVQPARVKWYDRYKGFGFANVFQSSDDVFLHAEVLRRSALSDLMPGEAIALRVANGRRGKLAVEIRPWEIISAEL